SHELRTPLYGIVGLAESLLDADAETGADKRRQQLEQIAASGRRLGGLVGDILDFAQLRDGRLELDLDVVDVHALVTSVLTLVEPLAAGAGLELRRSGPDELPPARADERRLRQILFSLVGNAIKFTERGAVEIAAKPRGELLEIAVRDTGIGIEREKLDAIFEAFEQADASDARRFGGTGLGLSLTRRLVDMHGGQLEVESTPGVGSTFRFTVPTAEGESAPPTSPRVLSRLRPSPSEIGPPETLAGSADEADFDAAHILVVDDEPILRLLLEGQLEAEGYRVTTADSGVAALDLLRSGEADVDLVVLDVMMPRLTGYEVCRALRADWEAASLPVLLLTAKDRLHDLVEGFAAGANDYLIKPVGREELVARVRFH
ncbi:MAG: ATP-binding protein, partial [Acidobacteriota bacterium]